MHYEFVTRMNVEKGAGHKWLRFGLNLLIIAGFIVLIDRSLEGNFDWIILLPLAGLLVFRLILGGGTVYREVPVKLNLEDNKFNIVFRGASRISKDQDGDKECKILFSDIRKVLFHQKAGLIRIDAKTEVKILNSKKKIKDIFNTQKPLVFYLPEDKRKEILGSIGERLEVHYVGQPKKSNEINYTS